MTNLNLAPPVRTVDGLVAVPIDVQRLDAVIVLDAATRQAQVDATVQFVTGGTAGCPVFDLRQTLDQAFLDGANLALASLAHHDFGGGPDSQLRVVDAVLPAGSTHSLRLVYRIGQPQAPSSQPIVWDPASTRVYWDFWFTDLLPGRYLESWLPANLIYDQFPINLEIELTNSASDHTLVANGSVTILAQNHWRIAYPSQFTSLSPMLLLAATDRIDARHGTMSLPGGVTLHLDTYKLTTTAADLAAVESDVRAFINANVANVGPYSHGDRFTTWVWAGSRSMEYDGGVTTNTGALEHEVFHSWYARGAKPASQNDGWLDEGWTTYNTDANRFQVLPFDFSAPPTILCGMNPFSRITPGASYSAGFRLFAGLAALVGLANLRAWMADFYRDDPARVYTTAEVEAYLIARSGNLQIADAFERFVYGLATQPAGADLYIRDAVGDPGADAYAGPVFWDSPDLWIRNADDDGAAHQSPEAGQDNWFYARVHNRGTRTARAFVVTFNVKPWLGMQFTYPGDFLPGIAAAVGFDLAPGASNVVKAKWPRALVPAAGTHACWLTSAYCPTDVSPAGRHVWEHNNLAQKNLAIVDVLPDTLAVIPVQLGSLSQMTAEPIRVEIRRPPEWSRLAVSLGHRDSEVIKQLFGSAEALLSPSVEAADVHP